MKLIASFAVFKESTSIIIKYFVCDPLYIIALIVLTTYTLSEDEKNFYKEHKEKYIQLKQNQKETHSYSPSPSTSPSVSSNSIENEIEDPNTFSLFE